MATPGSAEVRREGHMALAVECGAITFLQTGV
jgi:hypothetical protein